MCGKRARHLKGRLLMLSKRKNLIKRLYGQCLEKYRQTNREIDRQIDRYVQEPFIDVHEPHMNRTSRAQVHELLWGYWRIG